MKERYNIVLIGEEKKYIYVLQQVRRNLLPCHLIQYMFVIPTTYLKLLLFHRLQRQKQIFMAFKRVTRWCSNHGVNSIIMSGRNPSL